MNKFLTTVLVSFLLISTASAQTGTWQNITVFGGLEPVYSQMVFVNDSVGYIYGGTQTTLYATNDAAVNFDIDSVKTTLKGATFGAYMSWSAMNGCLIADTGSILSNDNEVFSIYTTNGGISWTTSEIADPNLQIQNLYFPTANVGYGTGSLADGSGDFVAKTTDGGATWKKIYTSTNYSFGFLGRLYFKDANNGMFFAQDLTTNKINLAYTTDGGATPFKFAPTATDSLPFFLQWNNDNSWLIGIDSVYRSVDSGKHWTSVVPYDTGAGPITVATFYDSVGFAFRAIKPIVYQTNDYGLTWTSSRLPTAGHGVDSLVDTVIAISASMPSPRVAYLLAYDANTGIDAIMRDSLSSSVVIPPKNGVASNTKQGEMSFAVYSDKSWINFNATSAPEARTIEIVDLLGRECASVAVSPNSASSRLALTALQPGSYFARLGAAIVKFNVWQ